MDQSPQQVAEILIIDSQPANVDFMIEALESEGYHLLVARSGRATLDLVSHKQPALIILNPVLPDMSGHDVYCHLRNNKATEAIPIIVVTCGGDAGNIVDSYPEGNVDYLMHPMTTSNIQTRVKVNLRLSRLTEALVAAETKQQDMEDQLQRGMQALRASEARLRLLMERMPAILWTIDTELRFSSSAGAALPAINLQPDQVVGMSLFDYFQTEDPAFLPVAAHLQALEGETTSYEAEWAGRTFHSHVEPLRGVDGEVAGAIGVALDVTPLTLAQRTLQESEKRYRSLYSSMNEGMSLNEILYDESGNALDYIILDVNSAYETLTGFSRGDAVGQRASVLYGTGNLSHLDIYSEVAETGRPTTFAAHFAPRDKHFSISVFSPQQGQFAAVLSDITAQTHIGEALAEARDQAMQASQSKSAFLANMSHEIRTPLNTILGYAQILERDSSLTLSQAKAIDMIQNSGNHLLGLINDILDLSKIEEGRMESHLSDFHLGELLHDISIMFELRCRGRGLSWSITGLDTADVYVRGEEGKLRQVIINLLSNAVKFTDVGEVHLRVRILDDSELRPHTDESEDRERQTGEFAARSCLAGEQQPSAQLHYLFEIIDTGVGISEEVQEGIFESFMQDEAGVLRGGTGLGLAIAKRHVEFMSGEIGVDSKLGRGSRFFFAIPLQLIDRLEHRTPSPIVRLAQGTHICVLVVDDTQSNRDVLTTLLRDLGLEVHTADDGVQTLEQARARAFDLVFMDIRMPGMDGIEAMRRIRVELGWDCPRIVAVSSSVLQDQERYLHEGFDDFVAKPFRLERICQCLEELLGVEFEHSETIPQELDTTPVPQQTAIPPALLHEIRQWAESYNVTYLETALGQLSELGEVEAKLAEQLLTHSRNLEIDEILRALDAYTVESPSNGNSLVSE